MTIEAVRAYLGQFGVDGRIRELALSSATVALAAEALNVAPERIAKTLSFAMNDSALLIVAAGDARIDNAKFKSVFGMKARMLSSEEALKLTGHAVGGVCPFALPKAVRVYLDISLKRFTTVFPACGSSNSAAEFSCEELERFSSAQGWVDVCKGWN